MMFKHLTVSDPYPCESCMTFKGGRYFKIVHVFIDIIESGGIRDKIGRKLIAHHVESNLPVKEFIGLMYWARIQCQGPIPKVSKHLFEGYYD